MVEGDRARLRQVLDNLLANVRSHAPPGTATRVEVARANGTVPLAVADDGPGMADEQAARAFERFYRADPSRSRDAGGCGLGLSIVAAIAEAHGGHVDLDTAPAPVRGSPSCCRPARRSRLYEPAQAIHSRSTATTTILRTSRVDPQSHPPETHRRARPRRRARAAAAASTC